MSFCYLTTKLRTAPIFGFPGLIIDSMGWLWSLKKRKPRRIGTSLTRSSPPYYVAMATKSTEYGTVERMLKIHTAVLEEFVGPRPEGMECRHLNGNSLDNRLENLAWGTHAENTEDMVRYGVEWDRKGNKNARAVLSSEQVDDIRQRWKSGEFGSVLAKDYGVSRSTIWWITSGRSWTHLLN